MELSEKPDWSAAFLELDKSILIDRMLTDSHLVEAKAQQRAIEVVVEGIELSERGLHSGLLNSLWNAEDKVAHIDHLRQTYRDAMASSITKKLANRSVLIHHGTSVAIRVPSSSGHRFTADNTVLDGKSAIILGPSDLDDVPDLQYFGLRILMNRQYQYVITASQCCLEVSDPN